MCLTIPTKPLVVKEAFSCSETIRKLMIIIFNSGISFAITERECLYWIPQGLVNDV